MKGLHTYQYGVALESNQSCAQQMAQRAALQAASTRHNRTAPPLDFGMCVRRPTYHSNSPCLSLHAALIVRLVGAQIGGSVCVS